MAVFFFHLPTEGGTTNATNSTFRLCCMPPQIIDVRKADDTRDVVHRAVQALAEGRLVVFPTETVYGVGALGLNEEAFDRLRAVKSCMP